MLIERESQMDEVYHIYIYIYLSIPLSIYLQTESNMLRESDG